MQKAILLSTLVFAAALAGCADEPPSGEFVASDPAPLADMASATLTVEPASNTYPANSPGGEECDLDAFTDAINENGGGGAAPSCEDPVSSVTGHFAALKTPAMSWSVWLSSADAEFKLGDLTEAEAGPTHYDLAGEFPGQDLSGYDEMQLRDGETVIATAGGMGGDFSLAAELAAVSAAVSYSGKDITVTLTDAPNGTTLVAWLVGEDAETGEATHDESFVLGAGETMYTATKNIADYSAFHIHVGSSTVNIAVAPIA